MAYSRHSKAPETAPRPHAARQAHRGYCHRTGHARSAITSGNSHDTGEAKGRVEGREGEGEKAFGQEAAGDCQESSEGALALDDDPALILEDLDIFREFKRAGDQPIKFPLA